jgi:hypothetical protein
MSVTRLRDISRPSVRRLAAAVVIALSAITAVSCGSDGSSGDSPKVVEIIVPAGTQDKLNRGEIVDVMPALLEFRVGDTLRVRNDDSHVQYAGPYRVLPGEQFELEYGAPGRYGGQCDLSGNARYEIVITE